MASRVRRTLPCLEGTEPERPPPALTSDLLEEIFLRVASPADLARASTACASFRRFISDPSFLRRYRSIHPPLLLGFVSSLGFQPVEAPHPSAAVARAVARAADFSFDYLPRPIKGLRWHVRDASDGRVLLEFRRMNYCWDLVVCDPLSRRYLLLPPITDDLLASVAFQKQSWISFGASFIPSGDAEETSFSVISWMHSETWLLVFVFTSSPGCWSARASTSLDDLGLHDEFAMLELESHQRVYGHIFWKLSGRSKLIKLDMDRMEFSTVDLPPDHDKRRIIIVELGGSKVAMFSLNYKCTSLEYYIFLQNGSEKPHEYWQMKSTIHLPAPYTRFCFIGGPAEGYIFLDCNREDGPPYSALFSLEIKSLKIESSISRVCFSGHLYFGFPPSMSPRRI